MMPGFGAQKVAHKHRINRNESGSSFSRGYDFAYKKDALGMILNGSEIVSGLSRA